MPPKDDDKQKSEDERDAQGNKQGDDQQSSSKYDPASVEDANKIIAALEKRIGEREATIDDLKGKMSSVSERVSAMDKAQKKKLEDEGNYRELVKQHEAEITTLKPYQERAQVLEEMIIASNKRRMETIPEDRRVLIPTDYAPEQLSAWLDKSTELLTKPLAGNIDAGAGGDGEKGVRVTDSDRQQAAIASAQGYAIKPEDIANRRQALAEQEQTSED